MFKLVLEKAEKTEIKLPKGLHTLCWKMLEAAPLTRHAVPPAPSQELCPASFLVTKLLSRIKFQHYLAREVLGLPKSCKN